MVGKLDTKGVFSMFGNVFFCCRVEWAQNGYPTSIMCPFLKLDNHSKPIGSVFLFLPYSDNLKISFSCVFLVRVSGVL